MKGIGKPEMCFSGNRRHLRNCFLLCLAMAMQPSLTVFAAPGELTQKTSSIQATFDAHRPGLSALSIDSLQKSSFRANPLVDPGTQSGQYEVSMRDGWVRYALSSHPDRTVWQMRADGDRLIMRSVFQPEAVPQDITWKFDPNVTHSTLLGHVTASGDIALPALIHLPGMGSMRISVSGNDAAVLHYDARRAPDQFVKVVFPAANAAHPTLEYTLQTVAIYPRPSTVISPAFSDTACRAITVSIRRRRPARRPSRICSATRIRHC
jgi:hypothetical protein